MTTGWQRSFKASVKANNRAYAQYKKESTHMATQEERLSGLEFDLKQFRTETLRVYTDLVYEVTILKGLGEDSIKRLAALQRETDRRFDLVSDRLSQMYDEINSNTLLLHEILERLPAKE
jgi:hypothetical protein